MNKDALTRKFLVLHSLYYDNSLARSLPFEEVLDICFDGNVKEIELAFKECIKKSLLIKVEENESEIDEIATLFEESKLPETN